MAHLGEALCQELFRVKTVYGWEDSLELEQESLLPDYRIPVRSRGRPKGRPVSREMDKVPTSLGHCWMAGEERTIAERVFGDYVGYKWRSSFLFTGSMTANFQDIDK